MKTKMLTNRKPKVDFDWETNYNPGKYLRISHIPEHDWFDPMSILLLQLSIDSNQELDMLLERSIQSERVTIQKILDLLATWDEQAYNTAVLLEAQKISRLAPPNHTNNQWQNTKSNTEFISNAVYTMSISLRKDAPRGGKTTRVSWTLRANPLRGISRSAPFNGDNDLLSVIRKPFPTVEAAQSYIEEIKQEYADLFQEEYPPIPSEWLYHFVVRGVLPPMYKEAKGLIITKPEPPK